MNRTAKHHNAIINVLRSVDVHTAKNIYELQPLVGLNSRIIYTQLRSIIKCEPRVGTMPTFTSNGCPTTSYYWKADVVPEDCDKPDLVSVLQTPRAVPPVVDATLTELAHGAHTATPKCVVVTVAGRSVEVCVDDAGRVHVTLLN